ncbi:non-oxidative hydroxyarylic acid decarboxylases subunit D [Bradyrhizobium sp. 139]|uniref:non-oxidative hydroxyarylic acid decarboxylases subunit D n=1 Tax=Bradyrhizobium sp. 139 TaxID=2782616 RepID=UPI0031FE5E6C
MNTPTQSTTPSICPRCRSKTVAHLASSPVAGTWTVFQCTTCLYTWRSSNPSRTPIRRSIRKRSG